MKIGLFGDSFGAPTKTYTAGDPNHAMQYHWATLLANDLDATVSVEAVSGSSLYYSFMKFLKSHHLYDTIFFVVTDSGRYPTPISNDVFVTGLDQIAHLRKSADDSLTKELDRISGWFTGNNYEFLINTADLMIEKILHLRPDTILVPVNEGSMSPQKFKEIGLHPANNLLNLYYEQIAQLDIPNNSLNVTRVESPEYISGHFVPEMHEHFYKIFRHRYDSGVWDWKNPPKLKFKHTAEQYYPFD
jgi:hypothetical protein